MNETTMPLYWLDPSSSFFFFSLLLLHRNISRHMNFEYKINLFQPRIETNLQFMTLEVISASSVVGRKAWKTHGPNGNRTLCCCLVVMAYLSLGRNIKLFLFSYRLLTLKKKKKFPDQRSNLKNSILLYRLYFERNVICSAVFEI